MVDLGFVLGWSFVCAALEVVAIIEESCGCLTAILGSDMLVSRSRSAYTRSLTVEEMFDLKDRFRTPLSELWFLYRTHRCLLCNSMTRLLMTRSQCLYTQRVCLDNRDVRQLHVERQTWRVEDSCNRDEPWSGGCPVRALMSNRETHVRTQETRVTKTSCCRRGDIPKLMADRLRLISEAGLDKVKTCS